jgi:hypothetical protein
MIQNLNKVGPYSWGLQAAGPPGVAVPLMRVISAAAQVPLPDPGGPEWPCLPWDPCLGPPHYKIQA